MLSPTKALRAGPAPLTLVSLGAPGQSPGAGQGAQQQASVRGAPILIHECEAFAEQMPIFPLQLQPTYFAKGFFNVIVDYDRYVRRAEGPVRLRLGRNGVEIEGKLSRHANRNGTARIFGGVPLREWFQANFEPLDTVAVDLSSEDVLVLDRPPRERAVP